MTDSFPLLLREHRVRRRWSQEHLALAADVSTRHLSCLENGKARPSREMVLALAAVLGLELRERNTLLVSTGFAAVYPTSPLDDVAMAPVNRAIELLLAQQEPYGAVVIDRCWNVLRANEGARQLFAAFLPASTVPPAIAANLVRATLHPEGLRPHIVNWNELVAVMLERLERAHHAHPGDEQRRSLLAEVRSYPEVQRLARTVPSGGAPVAVLHLRRGADELRLFTLLTTVGTPIDVTAEELTIESFFPADEATALWFRSRRLRGGHE